MNTFYQNFFSGVWISKELWFNPDFKHKRFLRDLLVTIVYLEKSSKYGSFVSNKYLASFFSCSENNISNALAELRDMGYIKIQYEQGNKQKRRIITNKLLLGWVLNDNTDQLGDDDIKNKTPNNQTEEQQTPKTEESNYSTPESLADFTWREPTQNRLDTGVHISQTTTPEIKTTTPEIKTTTPEVRHKIYIYNKLYNNTHSLYKRKASVFFEGKNEEKLGSHQPSLGNSKKTSNQKYNNEIQKKNTGAIFKEFVANEMFEEARKKRFPSLSEEEISLYIRTYVADYPNSKFHRICDVLEEHEMRKRKNWKVWSFKQENKPEHSRPGFYRPNKTLETRKQNKQHPNQDKKKNLLQEKLQDPGVDCRSQEADIIKQLNAKEQKTKAFECVSQFFQGLLKGAKNMEPEKKVERIAFGRRFLKQTMGSMGLGQECFDEIVQSVIVSCGFDMALT